MRYLFLTAVAVLALSACGGSSGGDQSICSKQSADLADSRAVIDKWSGAAFNFAPGEEQRMFDQVGSGISALTGYAPEDARLTAAVDKARDGLQGFYDDWTQDRVLDGSGQSVDTAKAALSSLNDVCGSL